jgi:hypothetical protein
MNEVDWLKIRATIRRHCRAAAGHEVKGLRRITAARIEENDIDDVCQECCGLAWLKIENGMAVPLAIWVAVRSIGRINRELAEGAQCESFRWEEPDMRSSQWYIEQRGRFDIQDANGETQYTPEHPRPDHIRAAVGLAIVDGRPMAVTAERIVNGEREIEERRTFECFTAAQRVKRSMLDRSRPVVFC